MKIPTKDETGRQNGSVIPLWSLLEEPELRPDQVYITSVNRMARKGPHLHMRRRGLFSVASGRVTIVIRVEGKYIEHELVPGNPKLLVPPGTPCAIYNRQAFGASVVNMPSPAWSKEDPDEHPVQGWKDPEWWKP